jgi:hypothetical protein
VTLLASVVAASDIPAAPVLGAMLLGVVVALAGHIVSDRRIVAVGVGAIFLATLLMVVFAFAAFRGDETDPRPCPDDTSAFCR